MGSIGSKSKKNEKMSSTPKAGAAVSNGRNRRLSIAATGGSAKGGDRLELGKELGGKNFSPNMPGDQPGEEAVVGGLRFAALSQAGYEPEHRKKENQDAYIVWAGVEHSPMFGVCDGHGAQGNHVSNFLTKEFCTHLDAAGFEKNVDDVSFSKSTLMDVFAKCNRNLSSQRTIDVNLSGSTCVTAMVRGGRIYCCNLGDSRCVLARQEGSKLKAIGLSDDQKPERADERARIIKSGGRVAPLEDEAGEAIGPQRVWLATMMVPGLAMTRSFGDHVAESVGVIPEPEIMDHVLTSSDRFMVLASDGVWEFLDNQAVVDLVASCDGNGPEACRKVIKASYDAWMKEEEVVDDITCVVVYFP